MKRVALILALVSTPALAAVPVPEGTFVNSTVGDAQGKVASRCMDLGWQVATQGTNEVTCQVALTGKQRTLTTMFYSADAQIMVQVQLAQAGPDVRGQARMFVERQSAYGQVRVTPLDDAKRRTELLQFLEGAGAHLAGNDY